MKINLIIAIIIVLMPLQTKAETPDELRQKFIKMMVEKHDFSESELKKVLWQAEKKETILRAISRPAEKVKPWWEYKKHFLTKKRIRNGVSFWKENKKILEKVYNEYGIPPKIIVSILGVETNYGAFPLRYRVLDALHTLGFHYPRRGKFFRSELKHFLLLAREEKINPLELKGSYAGAMGKPQFMPSSFRKLAIDYDKNGRRDIWGSNADIIGSIAFYLSKNNWQRNKPIAVELKISKKQKNFLSKALKLPIKAKEFREAGIVLPKNWKNNLKISFITLEGIYGEQYWAIHKNFKSILSYNPRNKYAMAVYQLGERIDEAIKNE